jgi:S1-C subfamily serine protease
MRLDLRGELIGNTAVIGPSGGNVGIGFAISPNMMRDILSQLVKYGRVRREQLAVMIQNLTPDIAQAHQACAPNRVAPSSPGLNRGRAGCANSSGHLGPTWPASFATMRFAETASSECGL